MLTSVKVQLQIGWRLSLWCALMLAVLLVPLAHSAHYHDGQNDGDASLNATCVVCQASGGYVATSPEAAEFPTVSQPQAAPAVESSHLVVATCLNNTPQRAPPSSL